MFIIEFTIDFGVCSPLTSTLSLRLLYFKANDIGWNMMF